MKRSPDKRRQVNHMLARMSAGFAVFAVSSIGASVAAQTVQLKVGDPSPQIKLEKLLQAPPEATTDWKGLRGKVVVLEFWATWCGPCIDAIPHINKLAEEFSGQPVVFISITDDDVDRVEKFLKTKPMKSWIGLDPNRANWAAYDVASIPQTVVVGADGRVSAVTLPGHVTAAVLRDVLAGKAVTLPAKENRPSDLEWDQNEIEWKDGVKPVSQVIIKPISTATTGSWVRPEGNYLTSDGAPLEVLVQVAYKIDHYHLDWRLPGSTQRTQRYRVVAQVPRGREQQLLPLLQSALTATFNLKTHWQPEEKDVYVLRIPANGRPRLVVSGTEGKPLYQSLRGKATAKRQPLSKLCDFLTNALGLPVVDETGLSDNYDWELPYQPGQAGVTLQAVSDLLGLELVKARRSIKMLVVEPSDTIPRD